MLLGEQLQPAVLGAVGVLVLVDQHVAEGAAVAVAHLLEQLEEFTQRNSRSSKSIAFAAWRRFSYRS